MHHRKRVRQRTGRGGFTMVELMIAIGVLLVAVMTALSSQVTSMNLMQTSRETNIALGDLQAAMEQALVVAVDDLPVAGSRFENGQPIPEFEGLHLGNERIVTTYPGFVPGAIPDPLTIVMTITFNDYGNRPRTMQLTSMKVR